MRVSNTFAANRIKLTSEPVKGARKTQYHLDNFLSR
jgi:hypothetical protein